MLKYKYLICLMVLALAFLPITKQCGTEDLEGEGETIKTFTVDAAVQCVSKKETVTDDKAAIVAEERLTELDELNAAQSRELKERAETFTFPVHCQLPKFFVNTIYFLKELYLFELISNASDALDKIKLLINSNLILDETNELSIRIEANKESGMLHITDTGIGMTREDLVKNLMKNLEKCDNYKFSRLFNSGDDLNKNINYMNGPFGHGFCYVFIVADKVLVTTKHNDDKQYIWESNANGFSIVEDPRGPTLKRGTQISLQLKEEVIDNLEINTLKSLVKKHSRGIRFPIYLWSNKTKTVDEPIEENEQPENKEKSEDDTEVDNSKEKTPKPKKVDESVWDWEIIDNDEHIWTQDWEILNNHKPIWTRKPDEVEANEYDEFYKALTKDTKDPLSYTHFNVEGEVSFKSLLYVSVNYPSKIFNIKFYLRKVFLTDKYMDVMPIYLSCFLQGIVDLDDFPLNISQSKSIRKILIEKSTNMIERLDAESYKKFWTKYSMFIYTGFFEEDKNPKNLLCLAKSLRFQSSAEKTPTSLADYVERMSVKQEYIYLITFPIKEDEYSLLTPIIQEGYEILYVISLFDLFALSKFSEFEGKKLKNVIEDELFVSKNKEKSIQHDEI